MIARGGFLVTPDINKRGRTDGKENGVHTIKALLISFVFT
jgi:hypothetical protein